MKIVLLSKLLLNYYFIIFGKSMNFFITYFKWKLSVYFKSLKIFLQHF